MTLEVYRSERKNIVDISNALTDIKETESKVFVCCKL